MKHIAWLITKATLLLHFLLKWFVSEKKLKEWKPVHLCWWFDKYGFETPEYFIGTHVTAPTVTTSAASGVSFTSFTGNGNITDTGGANATERGFCYLEGTSGDPTTANFTAFDSGSFGTGAYTKSVTGLKSGTAYRVRAYAINSAGTGYGSTVDVTTSSYSQPTGLSAKFGSFAKSTSTGNQSVSGLGFSPKVILFFGVNRTSDGSASNIDGFFGVAVKEQGELGSAAVYYSSDNVTTSVAAAGHASVRIEMRLNSSASLTNEGQFYSFDSDGFTVNWSTNDSSARIINYLALAGTAITSQLTGSVHVGTVTGNQNITGIPFTPTFVLEFNSASRNTDNSVGLNSIWGGFGATSSPSSERAYMAHFFEHNVSASSARARSVLKTNRSFGQITQDQRLEGDITSFNSDGYSINWLTHDGFQAYKQVLVMAGASYKVGTFNQKTSTGTQYVNVGIKPAGILLFSANQSTETISNGMKLSLGAGSSSSDRGCIFMGASNITSPTVNNSHLDRTKIIKMMTAGASASPTTQAAADLVSFDNTGFTLNWTTADATARKIGYIAFGTFIPSTTYTSANTAKASIKATVVKDMFIKMALGNKIYTRGSAVSLPSDDTNEDTPYTSTEVSDVASDDATRVSASGTGVVLHIFKWKHTNSTDAPTGTWNGQSDVAPSSNTVYLQIYNRVTPGWETLDSNSVASADTDFTLTGQATGTASDYYDSNNWVSFRVYQE